MRNVIFAIITTELAYKMTRYTVSSVVNVDYCYAGRYWLLR